jgi:hypothetical protein
MPQNKLFTCCNGVRTPTPGVGAWAGATPVWAPLARPDPLACCRRSGVAPAHAYLDFNRANHRRKVHDNVLVHTEAD